MARARDFYAGEGQSDPKDAFVLAAVARAHPSRRVWLTATPEVRAKLELLCGYDADLRADANRLTNRLRALLATAWPGLERARGDRLDTLPVLALLAKYPSAPDLVRARRARLVALLRQAGARRPDVLIDTVLEAATAQTVTVAGAQTVARIVVEVAGPLTRVIERRARLEDEITEVFSAVPEAPVLTSLPGIGPRLGARIAVEIGDVRRFPTADKLAAYAGLGPAPRQSGTSLKGNRATRHGNHRLKNAFFQAAFASLRHPPARADYDRKRAAGKRHNPAVLCLARRRVDVLHAMLTHNQPYSPPVSATDAAVAA